MAARAETTIRFTGSFATWLSEQTEQVQDQVAAAVRALRVMGVGLKEPTRKHLKGKIFELRCAGGNNAARVFYAFDVERAAVLLLGGSKADKKLYTRGLKQAEAELAAYEAALTAARVAEAGATKKRGAQP